jgi:antitoxin (DNA-binding transcriptional repressor) of toxin-antitoxin stability system
MQTATIEEVQARLPDFLDKLGEIQELVIVAHGKPVGRLLPAPPLPKSVPIYGRGKGKIISYVDDDEHLKDWAEYMP